MVSWFLRRQERQSRSSEERRELPVSLDRMGNSLVSKLGASQGSLLPGMCTQGLLCLSPFLLSFPLAQRGLCRETWLVAILNIYFLGGNDEAILCLERSPPPTPNASPPSALSHGSGLWARKWLFCSWPRTFDYASSRPGASRLFLKRVMWWIF